MTPKHINPQQWQHAIGIARQTCARIFRDGGVPADALEAFGIVTNDGVSDWQQAVDSIAQSLCAAPLKRAA